MIVEVVVEVVVAVAVSVVVYSTKPLLREVARYNISRVFESKIVFYARS